MWNERARFILCNSQCHQSIELIKRLTRGNSTNLMYDPRMRDALHHCYRQDRFSAVQNPI